VTDFDGTYKVRITLVTCLTGIALTSFERAVDCRPFPWEEYDFSLSEAMTDYWTNFAKTGDPNGKGLPKWPAFTAETPFTMNFTDDGFEARDIVDNAEANRVINFTIKHPGMLESLTDF
jgi:carboxylesterase type B